MDVENPERSEERHPSNRYNVLSIRYITALYKKVYEYAIRSFIDLYYLLL